MPSMTISRKNPSGTTKRTTVYIIRCMNICHIQSSLLNI